MRRITIILSASLILVGCVASKESHDTRPQTTMTVPEQWTPMVMKRHEDGAKPTDADRERLRATILRYEPKVVAFLGKAPARGFLQRRTMEWGLLPDCVGDSRLAVVPDTSGGNGHFERLKHYWRDVAEALAE